MIKLFELIKKNFKLLVRAKVSSLVIFIGPLLLVTLLGLAYSQSSTFTLTASVYSDQYTNLSESLVSKMTGQNFLILRQESVDACIGSVKRGESQACIVFQPGMEVKEDSSNQITFFVDYSQMNLVWFILDVMSARVSERSEEISKELTGDILDRMWYVEERIKSGQSTLSAVKANGDSIGNATGGMQTGFKRLDISVDFSGLGVAEAKSSAENISAALEGLKANMTALAANASDILENIEGYVTSIKSISNDSDVVEKANKIDARTDDVQEIIDDAVATVDSSTANSSESLASVKASFDAIQQKLDSTKTKIASVKTERDRLLPEFDRLGSEIDSMTSNIEAMQSTLNEALQRIVAIRGRSADKIVAPITTKIEPVTAQKTHFNSLFPTLVVIIIMITGILLASTIVIVEKKSKAFFRNNFTPTSYFTFNTSTYITSLIVILIQLLLFVSISAFFFETEVLASIWVILLTILLAATVFICLGMLIGYLFKTEATANLAAITLATIFLLFSSAVIPLESLPSYLKNVAMFNPFVMGEVSLKQSIIFHLGLDKTAPLLGMLAAYAAGIFLLLLLLQHLMRSITFMQFNSLHLGQNIRKEKKAHAPLARTAEPKKDINELLVNPPNK
ncbi:ABC transporter permease [Candidatus Woesearchaeota archaeon]|nr:ABC transporter permease [Candidatus Woesearchaeota archaeon]